MHFTINFNVIASKKRCISVVAIATRIRYLIQEYIKYTYLNMICRRTILINTDAITQSTLIIITLRVEKPWVSALLGWFYISRKLARNRSVMVNYFPIVKKTDCDSSISCD